MNDKNTTDFPDISVWDKVRIILIKFKREKFTKIRKSSYS